MTNRGSVEEIEVGIIALKNIERICEIAKDAINKKDSEIERLEKKCEKLLEALNKIAYPDITLNSVTLSREAIEAFEEDV
jgi:hypothetical protein